MSEVLFGQSYYLRFDPKLWDAMQPYPPLGTLYAAGFLREKGYDVALFDAMLAESVEDWAGALDRERPRFAILYEDNFNYLSKMCLLRMREAAFLMIRAARKRGSTVILCGSDASDHPSDYIEQGADFVLIGEGEITLGELIDRLTGKNSIPLTSISGLAFVQDQEAQGGSPRMVRTAPRPVIADLDSLPSPARDLVDIERYRRLWNKRHGYYSINMITTRGCPYHCNWCAKPIWGQQYHARSPERVVQEMVSLKESIGPDHIWFADDIMGLKPGWIERFAELVSASGARIPFKSLHRADLILKGDAIGALARAGARTVWLGAESGSQKILDAMEKGTTVAEIHEASRRLRAVGIEVCFFVQFGYPGETRDDIGKTLRMIRDCAPDDIGVSVSYPLPGTRFYESVKARLGPHQNWLDSSDMAMLYGGPFTTRFYRQLHTVLHKEFRVEKSRREIQSLVRRARVGPPHLRRVARMCYDLLTLPAARMRLERLAALPDRGISGAGGRDRNPDPVERARQTRTAFDSVASFYDGPFGNNPTIQRMREELLRTVRSHVPAGGRLLDLGCGTGIDAGILADAGYRVVATDCAPEMIRRTEARISEGGLGDRVRAIELAIHELDRLPDEPASFDGIYSDLGPFNCVADLRGAARECARLLRPGGVIIASVMGRICPWELLYYAIKGNARRSRVRFQKEATPVTLNGRIVWTTYWSPREFYGFFSDSFRLFSHRALGLFVPPPYLARFTEKFLLPSRFLWWMDRVFGRLPLLRDAGDHFLIVMRRHD